MKSSEQDHRKPCTLCERKRDVLVRCQIDETGQWHFVCPGTCWKEVSGGEIDGDKTEEHQYYRYGGMWKNKHEAVSAKKPKKPKTGPTSSTEQDHPPEHAPGNAWRGDVKYARNDLVQSNDLTWICRKTHISDGGKPPEKRHNLWKEQQNYVVEDNEGE